MSKSEAGYSIQQHKHLYASWCAARAYGRGLRGGGNKTAFALIEACGLRAITGPNDIGQDVDAWLLGYMRKILAEAKRKGIASFTFGHAQKLVNIYLKTVLVCGGHHEHPLVAKLHPPLDFVLLNGLSVHLRENRQANEKAAVAFSEAQDANAKWTAFSEADYVAHIDAIKLLMGPRPLYLVEEFWNL